jgi:hypothetical protein
MRSVWGRAGAAQLLASLWLSLGCQAASASSSPDTQTGAGDLRLMLFAGTDLWRHGGFSHAGVTWSPGGIDREGFVLKAMAGGGLYRYRSGALGDAPVLGRQFGASVLPGWRFIRGRAFVSAFAGLDLQNHRLMPDDLSAGLRGAYAGLRIAFESWIEPTPETMIAADGSFTTIGPGYAARIAFGWRVLERFYAGPEAQAFGAGDNYRQVRAGLHVTGLKTGRVEWSTGVGWSSDTDDRSGLYGKLNLLRRL